MHNKFGAFDFEEIENSLYSMEISARPVAAAGGILKDKEDGGSSMGEDEQGVSRKEPSQLSERTVGGYCTSLVIKCCLVVFPKLRVYRGRYVPLWALQGVQVFQQVIWFHSS